MKFTLIAVSSLLTLASAQHWTNVPGQPKKACVADGTYSIAFDGGPSQHTTPTALTKLKEADMKAVFHFSTEHLTDRLISDQLIATHNDGHIIGLRYPSALKPNDQTEDEIADTIIGMSNTIHGFVGVYPKYVRFNMEDLNDKVMTVLSEMKMVPTSFNLDAQDYLEDRKGEDIISDLTVLVNQFGTTRKDGVIISGTDLRTTLPNALDDIKTFFDGRGYNYVSLNVCVGESAEYRATNERKGKDKDDDKDNGSAADVAVASKLAMAVSMLAGLALF